MGLHDGLRLFLTTCERQFNQNINIDSLIKILARIHYQSWILKSGHNLISAFCLNGISQNLGIKINLKLSFILQIQTFYTELKEGNVEQRSINLLSSYNPQLGWWPKWRVQISTWVNETESEN